MDSDKFINKLTSCFEKAKEIACEKKGYTSNDICGVSMCDDLEIEVEFYFPPACRCCSGDTEHVYIKLDEIK